MALGAQPFGWAVSREDTADGLVEVRVVQPFQAVKTYLCPGCNHEVAAGTSHLVVVPVADPDGRRHWHRPCWEQRHRRRPGR